MLLATSSTAPFKAGWVFNLGQLVFLLALGFTVLIAISYWFLRPRFARLAMAGRTKAAPAASPALAPVPAAPATAVVAPAEEAAPAATPAPVVTPGGEVTPDQETYDKVLAGQLAKGVNKKVAEGRARAAALVAARKRAEG
jgi:zona occludens toxin (predicted ATPase)